MNKRQTQLSLVLCAALVFCGGCRYPFEEIRRSREEGRQQIREEAVENNAAEWDFNPDGSIGLRWLAEKDATEEPVPPIDLESDRRVSQD